MRRGSVVVLGMVLAVLIAAVPASAHAGGSRASIR